MPRRKRELKPLSSLPSNGNCPRCKGVLWEGGPPQAYEFPLVCECDLKVTLRRLGYEKA